MDVSMQIKKTALRAYGGGQRPLVRSRTAAVRSE